MLSRRFDGAGIAIGDQEGLMFWNAGANRDCAQINWQTWHELAEICVHRSFTVAARKFLLSRAREQAVRYANLCNLDLAQKPLNRIGGRLFQ
jgi:hypothetical protein